MLRKVALRANRQHVVPVGIAQAVDKRPAANRPAPEPCTEPLECKIISK
jgi:hypothetical protein